MVGPAEGLVEDQGVGAAVVLARSWFPVRLDDEGQERVAEGSKLRMAKQRKRCGCARRSARQRLGMISAPAHHARDCASASHLFWRFGLDGVHAFTAKRSTCVKKCLTTPPLVQAFSSCALKRLSPTTSYLPTSAKDSPSHRKTPPTDELIVLPASTHPATTTKS